MADKALLKVSGVMAIVIGIICSITIVGAIVGVPLIIGGITINRYCNLSNKELKEKKDSILTWCIVFLFLCTISGVLLLIFYLEFNKNDEAEDVTEEIAKYRKMYDDKLITEKEFEQLKKNKLGI